jgi:hypothetical protein
MVNSYGTQLNASNKNDLTFVVVIAIEQAQFQSIE